MRKRNIVKVADTVFWWIVYAVPLIVLVVCSVVACMQYGNIPFGYYEGSFEITAESIDQGVAGQFGSGSLEYIVTAENFDWAEEVILKIFYNANYAFSDMGFFETPIVLGLHDVILLLLGDGIDLYGQVIMFAEVVFAWFIYMHLFHLFVDFMLFIPRLAHKWMGKATEED